MISDCAVNIGSSHPVCQDYARTGENSAGPFVVVADGCSSSADTDIGARLLVLSAEKALKEMPLNPYNLDLFRDLAIVRAAEWAKRMGLAMPSLDATLMTVSLMANGKGIATVFGDGLVVAKTSEGLYVNDISYSRNFPAYPSYRLDEDRMAMMPADNHPILELWRLSKEGSGWKREPVADGAKGVANSGCHCYEFPLEGNTFVAVATDGTKSFLSPCNSETTKTNAPVPLEAVLPELLDFKNFQPGFAQRRMQRFHKDMQKNGWQHYDDLAIGILALGGLANS